MKDLKERILDFIGNIHLAGFATVTEDGKPWVRYVMPIASPDMLSLIHISEPTRPY